MSIKLISNCRVGQGEEEIMRSEFRTVNFDTVIVDPCHTFIKAFRLNEH